MRSTGSIYKYKSRAITVSAGENRGPQTSLVGCRGRKCVSKVGTQRHREGMLRDRERQRTRNCTWKAKEECFTKQTAIGVR